MSLHFTEGLKALVCGLPFGLSRHATEEFVEHEERRISHSRFEPDDCWCSTQVITIWRKAPCQTRRLPRSGIFTVDYAAIRSRYQLPISPSKRPPLGSHH